MGHIRKDDEKMTKSRRVSSVRMKAKEVYAVNLITKTGMGSRRIPLDWLGVDIAKSNPALAEKLEAHVDKAKVHIIPALMRKELTNFNAKVRNSMVLKSVPTGLSDKSLSLMTKTMHKKAKAEFDLFRDDFDVLVDTIDKEFDTYEKDFFALFNEALKGNTEKDAIIRELKATMPSKMDYMNSLEFRFEELPLSLNKALEDKFISKALRIAYERAGRIEKLAFKNDKIDMRSLRGIEGDIETFKDLEVGDISEVKEITKDLNQLLGLNGHGKSSVKKAEEIKKKVIKYAKNMNTLEQVIA